MPDMEKVVRGLEICSELGSWHGRDCFNDAYKDCPYRGCETGCVVTIAKDAIALLKEQKEKDEKILTALDGYRMCDEMSKNAYDNLTKLIRSERGEVE